MKVFVRAKEKVSVNYAMQLVEHSKPFLSDSDPEVMIADLTEEEVENLRGLDKFEVFDDIKFELFHPVQPAQNWWERQQNKPLALSSIWQKKTQNDVMNHIRAATVWRRTKGKGVTIAVVDTGTDGTMNEFPNKSSYSYSKSYSDPWQDNIGHGTMCAAIACGTDAQGGRFNGVAPEATLLSARSTLMATDIYFILNHLLREKKAGNFNRGLVVSNSYGHYTCDAPKWDQGHPYADLIKLCVAEGIVFVFAAGNNHSFGCCNNSAQDCEPNTIWAVNSMDEVISVGTVDWDESNQKDGSEHSNSSRGPGQWAKISEKPDIVAPTYGEVAWGAGYQKMEWWGTSGACPQVAGLSALLLSIDSTLKPEDIKAIIRRSARKINAPKKCVGEGIIDCEEALKLI